MNADLCRRLARALQSPYYMHLGTLHPEIGDRLQNECLEAYAFEKLPEKSQEIILKSERSFDILQRDYGEKSVQFLKPEQLQEIFLRTEKEH